MKLTILIPVSDDIRIKRCIESIDEDVEIIIIFNFPSKEVKTIIKNLSEKYNLLTTEINERNLAKAYNLGTVMALNNNILLMDSDCIFEKNTIKKLQKGMDKNFLSKGRVIYQTSGFISRIIAGLRNYITVDRISAFSPPLIFSKKIKKKIKGYYFYEKLCWIEDAEFNERVQNAKVKISYDSSAVIYHDKLTLKEDLRSSYRYGTGRAIADKEKLFKNEIRRGNSKDFLNIFKKKGFLIASYSLVWNIFFRFGYKKEMKNN